jgi:formylmethanofuran dehydrogenase subunit E
MCYRVECGKSCDVFKKQTCQYRLNKRQFRYKLKIQHYTCMDCGEQMVEAKYRGTETMLCTNCNHVLQELQRSYVS